jgi:uncharacterized Zn finger protein (UPF0148 family)
MTDNLEMFGGSATKQITRCPHCGSETMEALGATMCTSCDFHVSVRTEQPKKTDFQIFHEENPHVYDEIVRLARVAKTRGHTRWGIKGIFEVLRWSQMITNGDNEFKLNNNYTSAYARLVMENEPDLEDFFETRSIRSPQYE